ncbi:MAG: hypothetical protein HRU46_08930 [Verrucomicrobiales bacterium]|nr:hypothetical protein [Verrucomicrobiales bacterium]
MVKSEALAKIQGVEDQIINRFCSVKRRVEKRLDWIDENTAFSELEDAILQQILFHESRGYYLFQEPWLEHEPFNHRFRVVLTFRPTESNR